MKKNFILFLLLALGLTLHANASEAGQVPTGLEEEIQTEDTTLPPGLNVFQTFTGHYGVSTDGFGSTGQKGEIHATIPKNSTIIKAYLYSAAYNAQNEDISGLKFNNSAVRFDKYYINPVNSSFMFKTGRADVTAQVKATYNTVQQNDIYTFQIEENNAHVDGEALIVIYENSALSPNTIAVIEGGANINGDTFLMHFDEPLNPEDENFALEMYLGISYSCCGQASRVTVNDQIITEQAGDYDDGKEQANGSLITVGGFDDPFSPNMPSYTEDHEKYNLKDYIKKNDTDVKLNTINPSKDDNLFLVVLKASGTASVCDINSPCYQKGFADGKAFCKAHPKECKIFPKTVVIPY